MICSRLAAAACSWPGPLEQHLADRLLQSSVLENAPHPGKISVSSGTDRSLRSRMVT